jgi:hypothetical protein
MAYYLNIGPLCNIIVCSDPPTVPNAVFSLELAETVIFKYNCTGGLNLIGDNAIQCQDDCDVLESCLIAAKIEGFKGLLPKYGMRCT